MAQLERKESITYRWWNNDIEEISSEHAELLDVNADEQIKHWRAEGMTSGELNAELDGVHYRGWFELTTETL